MSQHALSLLRLSALCGGALLLASVACIPSFPPCDCGKVDDTGGMAGEFPDFEFLDRSADCAEFPLPEGDGDGDGDGDAPECGYPEGPYGFEVGNVFENLELFDCEGNPVQIAQYIPQVGLPEVETRGIVFGVGAAWCAPCAEEAKEWAENHVDEWEPMGILFIQALDEGAVGAATAEICAGWSSTNAQDKFPILFTPDQGSLQSKIEGQSGSPIPYTLLFDANANIIFKQTGGVVDSGVLETQLSKLVSDPYG